MATVDSIYYVGLLSRSYYSVSVSNTTWFVNTPSKHKTLTRCWSNAGTLSATLAQHRSSTGSTPRVCWAGASSYCWWRVQTDTNPMSVKCWASVAGAGQYSFSPSQCFMLAVPAQCLNQSWVNVGDAVHLSAWRQTRHDNSIVG